MRALVKITITFALCLLTFSAFAITPGKEHDILTLSKLMGNSSLAEELADSMVSIIIAKEKKRNPNLPKGVESALSQVIYDVIMEHAVELDGIMLPVYDKYYTHQEIRDLIEFFKTPTGKKYASVLKPMMLEIMPIAQTWGEKIAPIVFDRVVKELTKHGYN